MPTIITITPTTITRCRTKFEGDPAKYVHGKVQQAQHAEVPEGTIYTCPMHPQIRQVGPGNCPICGMALEPEVATAETGPNPELIDMTRRFWVGLALSVPVAPSRSRRSSRHA